MDPMFNKDSLGVTPKQRNEIFSALEEGIRDAFRSGVPSGFPLVDTNISLVEVQHTGALPHTFKIAAVQVYEISLFVIFHCTISNKRIPK